jgi:hypothetical protein
MRLGGHTSQIPRPEIGANVMELILWIAAVILVILGIVTLVRERVVEGLALIVIGLLVGPGGVSLFT